MMQIRQVRSLVPLACVGLAVGALIAQSSPGTLADTLHAPDDAYIKTDKSGKNSGSDKKIKLDDDRIGFGKFDLSTLPDGVVADDIVKATSRDWIEEVKDDGTISVESADGDRDEDSLTADNAPSTGATFSSTSVAISEDDEPSIIIVDVESHGALNVALNRGLLNLEARDMPLESVLREVAIRGGFALSIRGELHETVNDSFMGLTFVAAIRRLLGNSSFVVELARPEGTVVASRVLKLSVFAPRLSRGGQLVDRGNKGYQAAFPGTPTTLT